MIKPKPEPKHLILSFWVVTGILWMTYLALWSMGVAGE